jgi:hypothetical protein
LITFVKAEDVPIHYLRMPAGVHRLRVPMARRPREHGGPDQELEKILFRPRRRHIECRPLYGELVPELLAKIRRLEVAGLADDVEGVLVRHQRNRVKREPAIRVEITFSC